MYNKTSLSRTLECKVYLLARGSQT